MTTQEMEMRLKSTYPQCEVVVIDLTGTNDHFEVRIAETQFNGMSRIQQHQAVMKIFAEELKTGEVHALSIKALPKE